MIKIVKKVLAHFGYRIERDFLIEDIDKYIELYGHESVKNKRFYNICVGTCFGFGGGINHPCWTNIDIDRSWKNDKDFPNSKECDPVKDIAHDLLSMKPIPVESSSAELVHSRFTVDRLTDDAAQYFMKEVYRILKTRGIFRLVSTDLDLDFRAYQNNDKKYYFWLSDRNSIEQLFLYHVVNQVSTLYPDKSTRKVTDDELKQLLKNMNYEKVMNYCTSLCSIEIQKENRYDHFNWWNQKKYERMLKNAGFKTFYRSAPEQSVSPVLRNSSYFDNKHIKVMMYMEAIKD